MAYVVRRPLGRWEIRESYATGAGPRSRTLATFRALSPKVIERAAGAAQTHFDPNRLLRAARRAGVPFEPAPGDAIATSLIRGIACGERVRPGLRRLLRDRLDASQIRPVDESLAEWIGATPEERAAALVDLLGLADRLPRPRAGPLEFPRLARFRTGD